MKSSARFPGWLLTLLALSFTLSHCSKDDQKPQPSIISFSPASGFAGSQVTLIGNNLSDDISAVTAQFNGTMATVTSSSKTQVIVTVPSGATTGKITLAVVDKIVSSTTDFTVLIPQTITSFSPTSGQAGSSVTIVGTDFSTTISDNQVKFNGISATVTAATVTSLTVTVPAGTVAGKISITKNGNTVTSISDFQLIIDIPRNGLVAFYPFSGSPFDDSGNGAHGVLHIQNGSGGLPPILAADRFGSANHTYDYDGIGSYIVVGNPSVLQLTGQLTIAGWFYSKNNTATGVGGIYHSMEMISKVYFDPTAGDNPKGGFSLSHQGSGATFYPNFGGVGGTLGFDPVVDLNTWVFVAAVIDGTGYSLYKNGQVVGRVNAATVTDSRGSLIIGSYGGGFLFKGMIDDVAIYNRALSATEITQLYQQNITK